MAHIGSSPKDSEAYIIRSCTNTGVWIVETQDNITGQLIRYDFVNKEYEGPETGGLPVPYQDVASEQAQQFLSLQKTLNKALLRD